MTRTRLAIAALAAAGITALGMAPAQAATPAPAGSVVVDMGVLPVLVEHEDGSLQWLNGAGAGAQVGYSAAHVRRVWVDCTNRKVERIHGGFWLYRKGWSIPANGSFVRFYDCPVKTADQSVLARV